MRAGRYLGTVLFIVLVMAGCGSSRVSTVMTLEPGGEAMVAVEGEYPLVLIDNRGPGAVRYEFQPRDGSNWNGTVIIGSVGKTLRGGGEVHVSVGEEPAEIEVDVQRAGKVTFAPSRAPDQSEH